MAFASIHTLYGLTRLAQAESTGAAINLPTMAIGDGNGSPVTPAETQTQLARERYRAAVNRVYQDPVDPLKFSAELVIPASIGGFVMREVGVFDDSGSLFVVGNLPETYKPEQSDDGAFSDTVVRLDFLVANAYTIQIIADPNVVVVTQQWISNNVTAATLIPGGTTGQVLSKASNLDGDMVWKDPDTANVVVDVIEERQLLAADQTAVTWSIVTTRGLAVYINGLRLTKGAEADEWSEDPADLDTTILLGQSYPAGTEIVGVQNDPTGTLSFPLVRDLNLADVPDKALGRQNLGVFSRAETRQMAPAGMVAYFCKLAAPPGWLKANGAEVSRTAYADLFAAIGATYGAGNGFDTFNLPDLRGEFIRGLDDGRGVDAGRGLGTAQADQNKEHDHASTTTSAGGHAHSGSYQATSYSGAPGAATGNGFTNRTTSFSTSTAGAHVHGVNIEKSGGNEARPRNVALLPCIKY
ncbi:phage tail-collar fiber domain-containing protein [Stutzerimonas stutzeri]